MSETELKNALESFLERPEIKAIPWEECVRAVAETEGFSEEWIQKELKKQPSTSL